MNAPFAPPVMQRSVSGSAIERMEYDGARGFDPISLAATLLIMAGLFAVLMTMAGHHRHHRHHRQHLVFDMLEMPRQPPPPARPTPQPQELHKTPPPISEVVAPVPQVVTPTPAPAVFVTETAAPPRPAPAAASAEPAPAAPPAPPAPVAAGDLSAKMLSAKPPSYPLESRRLREQGTVVLAVLLATDGRVEDISVAHSSGFDRLDHAALSAVRSWRWSPLMHGGEAVMVRGMVTIPFVLRT